MSTEALRWAVIGAGGMGRWHLSALLKREDVRLVAACDVSRAALESLPEDVARFTDWRTLVESVDVDGASVILPHHLYPEVVVALLDRGVHVLKEKPFARDLRDAEKMCRAAESSGRQLVVAGQHKFKSSFVTARESVAELGEVFLTRASILYLARAIALDGKWSWRGTRSLSGGVAIVDSGWHILEMLTLIRGLPNRVAASTARMRVSPGEFDVDEVAVLTLEYPDGGLGVVLSSFVTTPGETRLTLYGTRATLDVDLDHEKATLYAAGASRELLSGPPLDPATHMYDLFVGSIRTGAPSPGDWREAVRVQQIIEAGYVSVSRDGAPVDLEEVSSNRDA